MKVNFSKMKWSLCTTLLCYIVPLSAAAPLPPNEEKVIQDSFQTIVNEPGAVLFSPPENWFLADPKALPAHVKIMVVGKGASEYPPSMNLATEKYNGTLKQYLKIIKTINENNGYEWKDLGTIRTEAGEASLSQVDIKSKWGTERLMHVIMLRDGTVYILSAAALKDEFPKFYREFFTAMRSLRINKSVYDMVADNTRRTSLQRTVGELKHTWKAYYQRFKMQGTVQPGQDLVEASFASKEFQEKYWTPFKTTLTRDYADMGNSWQQQMLDHAQDEILE